MTRRRVSGPASAPSLMTGPAWRAALGVVWDLLAAGPEAGPQACRVALAQARDLETEIGEPEAGRLRWQAAVEYQGQHGRCPYCGEPGVLHDPDDAPAPAPPVGGDEAAHAWRNQPWARSSTP